jgi:uncharacterized protein YbjT (DUF2867 family)
MAESCAIAGASGLVGSHLLTLLLREFDQVAAVTRRPLGVSAPHLREIAFGSTLPAIDAAFCCLGTTIKKAGSQEAFRSIDFGAVVDFAKAARAAGASRFAVVSSVGASPASSNFYLRVKGETEEALRTVGFERLAVMRPSFLLGDRKESRLGEKMGIAVAKAVGPLLVGPLQQYRAVEASRVAATMIQALAEQSSPFAIYHYRDFS